MGSTRPQCSPGSGYIFIGELGFMVADAVSTQAHSRGVAAVDTAGGSLGIQDCQHGSLNYFLYSLCPRSMIFLLDA